MVHITAGGVFGYRATVETAGVGFLGGDVNIAITVDC